RQGERVAGKARQRPPRKAEAQRARAVDHAAPRQTIGLLGHAGAVPLSGNKAAGVRDAIRSPRATQAPPPTCAAAMRKPCRRIAAATALPAAATATAATTAGEPTAAREAGRAG